jgi:hypothetical protein
VRTIALRGLFSKQSAAKRRPGLVAWGIAMAIGAGILAVVFGGMRGNPYRTAPPLSSALSTPGGGSPGGASAPPSSAPATVKPRPGPLQVTLHATGLSWVDACADGKRIFSRGVCGGGDGEIQLFEGRDRSVRECRRARHCLRVEPCRAHGQDGKHPHVEVHRGRAPGCAAELGERMRASIG